MATKKEQPVVSDETGKIKVKTKTEKQPDVNETKGNVTKVKEKMKMKPQVIEETITKVDLDKPTKPEENEIKENNLDNEGVVAVADNADAPQEQKEIQPETETQETPVLEEITEEENVEVEEIAAEASEAIKESIETGEPLPDNIQKLMNFMEETGGDLNDYVKLNQDYSELDNQDLLREYYQDTKPHLNAEEISFLMEDQFSYDEDADDDRDIKKKKIALKEQVANAKSHLDGQKSKYYEDIKAGSKLTTEQQKAINFFDRYNKEEAENKQGTEERVSIFKEKTNNVFNDKFKGFEYNVGEKKYRYNVQDVKKVGENQSDISNFIGKFLDENNTMKDAEGYHKSLFTANNADAIAKHFYEQGKSDAIKQSVEKGKNISMEPRQSHGEMQTGGMKVKALGDTTADFKYKIKNNKFKN
jgi:hypothetical protein